MTHDQSEAFGIADRVAVMNRGKIEQAAPPHEIYTRPKSQFVANFLGLSNILSNRSWVNSDDQLSKLIGEWESLNNHGAQTILIPPYAANLSQDEGLHLIEVLVQSYSFRGRLALLDCEIGEHHLEFSLDPYSGKGHSVGEIEAGDRVSLWIDPTHFVMLND